ncbi:Deoxyribonuclease [Streptococcus gordonii]|uniref:Deoxyribonuclease n=1 Tax=Streptococcus gordonii TaxID=1302 RepID=A0A139N5A6_STRGN|nr:Deoxyribonuclease [Streptococcus gordonii]
MKKWLFLTALTALLLGACSTENEVSQENSDKQIGFVQKEDKNSLEKAEKEKLEKEKKKKNNRKKRKRLKKKENHEKKRGRLAKNKKEERRKPNKL